MVALDLSTAFNMVNHAILLDILNHKYGIVGKALKCFNQYLRPRSFKVTVNGTYSTERDLDVSMPQGSCAGANIFNLYCSPLSEVIPPNLQLSGFADDHSVCKSFKAVDRQMEHNTISELEDCMINVKSWMDQTRLKMNPSKTEFINFGSRQQLAKCTHNTINIAGDLILRSDIIRYLGVWMDKELNFKQHVTKKCLCAMINYKRIQSIRHLLNTKTTESLCLSLCVFHLNYCNSILYGLPMVTLSYREFRTCVHN